MRHTVDITPAGLATPEGQARATETLRAKEEARDAIVKNFRLAFGKRLADRWAD